VSPELAPLQQVTKRGYRRVRRALGALAGRSEGEIPQALIPRRDRVFGLGPDVAVQPSARLIVQPGSAENPGKIVLGRGVYLGRMVELATFDGAEVRIGDDTSIQDNSVVNGHVTIGAHCILSMNIFAGSGIHNFRDKPSWLIRDQDAMMRGTGPQPGTWSRPIVVEDDCWIGWGVVITPGIYIGRGAVVGANSVVTSDIAPYEVHGGIPNRRVSTRLDFAPPERIDAADDNCFPYFYRGFCLSQRDVAKSRARGVIDAQRRACLVLSGQAGHRLQLEGFAGGPSSTRLQIHVNGTAQGRRDIGPGDFAIECETGASAAPADVVTAGASVPAALSSYTYVELTVAGGEDGPSFYGIRSASLSRG